MLLAGILTTRRTIDSIDSRLGFANFQHRGALLQKGLL